QRQALGQPGVVPRGVPPFVLNMMDWPYIAGPRFIATLYGRGGTASVNRALRDLPASTEQVMHPSRYPDDRPQPVDVPDLGPKLGPKWRDLDVQEVGEAWLADLLGLRLDPME